MGRRAVKPILMFKDMYVVNSHQTIKNYALSFDGVNDYVDFGLIPSGDLQNISIEIEFLHVVNGVSDALLFWNGKAGVGGLLIYKNSGDLISISRYAPGENALFANIGIAGGLISNDYNSLYLKYTENGLTLNMNGVETLRAYSPLIYTGTDRKTYMGASYPNAIYGETIFKKSLIKELDSSGNEIGEILNCSFDGNVGTLNDISGNANNGTINGATWIQL